MRSSARSAVVAVLLMTFGSNTCFGQIRDALGVNKENLSVGGVAEYVFRNSGDELLMPVFVIGAVQRPGLYHVPMKTDMITLLALTGGPTSTANIEQITLRKGGGKLIEEFNLEKMVGTVDLKPPALAHNDTILIKDRQPVISNNTTILMTTIASVLGIIIAGIAISKTK